MTSVARPWAVYAGGWWGWHTVGRARYATEAAADAAARKRYPLLETTLGYDVGIGRTDRSSVKKVKS